MSNLKFELIRRVLINVIADHEFLVSENVVLDDYSKPLEADEYLVQYKSPYNEHETVKTFEYEVTDSTGNKISLYPDEVEVVSVLSDVIPE